MSTITFYPRVGGDWFLPDGGQSVIVGERVHEFKDLSEEGIYVYYNTHDNIIFLGCVYCLRLNKKTHEFTGKIDDVIIELITQTYDEHLANNHGDKFELVMDMLCDLTHDIYNAIHKCPNFF